MLIEGSRDFPILGDAVPVLEGEHAGRPAVPVQGRSQEALWRHNGPLQVHSPVSQEVY